MKKNIDAWIGSIDVDELRDGAELAKVGAALTALEDAERALTETVRTARDAGHSWTVIAAVLGTSRQNAYRKFAEAVRDGRGLPPSDAGRRMPKVAPKAQSWEVVPNAGGGWDVTSKGGRVAAHADTQAQAIARAKQIVRNKGGGEVTIVGRDGRIQAGDSVAPGDESRSISS